MSRRLHADRLHALALAVTGALIVAYWAVYFTSGANRSGEDAVYVGFENAFPLADSYMTLCLFIAAIQLWRGRPSALFWGIAGGSALIFLGLMDVLFNLEQGKYAEGGGPMLAETLINLFSLGFGPYTMLRLWKARARLLGPG